MSVEDMMAEVAEQEKRLMEAPIGTAITVESEDVFSLVTEVLTKDARLEGWRIGDTTKALSNHELAIMVTSEATEVMS